MGSRILKITINIIMIFIISSTLNLSVLVGTSQKNDNHGFTLARRVFAQTEDIPLKWVRIWGDDSGRDGAYSVTVTEDGGLIICCNTYKDIWLIKTNYDGEVQWHKTFGASEVICYGASVANTLDGGFIITGSAEHDPFYSGNTDVLLIKTDAEGNKVWDKTFGGSEDDSGASVIVTPDNCYLIIGNTMSFGVGKGDIWLIKVDENGNEVWNKTFGGPSFDSGASIIVTPDSSLLVVGSTESYGAGGEDVWLIKTDVNGNKVWDKTFGGLEDDSGASVIAASEDSFIIAGQTESDIFNNVSHPIGIWLINVDTAGNLQWQNTFGGSNDYGAKAVAMTPEGGCIVLGNIDSHFNSDYSAWIEGDIILIETDSKGIKICEKTFGGSNGTIGNSIVVIPDGSYIVAGSTYYYVGTDALLFNFTLSHSSENPTLHYEFSPTFLENTWTKTYGGDYWDCAYWMEQTKEGGYVLAGATNSCGSGKRDVYLVKTDSSGTADWSRTYGGSNNEEAFSVQQTLDGGYIIAGYMEYSGSANADFYLVKTDSCGGEQWSKTYGGTGDDKAYSVRQAVDGGYIVAGYTESFGAGQSDFYLVKTDSSGKVQWSRTYGGDNNEQAFSLQCTLDGGYILAGYTESFGAGQTDFYIVKTDSQGIRQWSKNYGEAFINEGHSIQQTSDGGYIVAGRMIKEYYGNYSDFYIIKLNSTGEKEWSKTYNGLSHDNAPQIEKTIESGYIVVSNDGLDSYVMKLNPQGEFAWGRELDATMYSVHQTQDGKYVLAGERVPLEESTQAILTKLGSEEITPPRTSTLLESVRSSPSSYFEKPRTPPYVGLYAPITEVCMEEEVLIWLSVINPLTSEGRLIAKISLEIPSGWSVTTGGFIQSSTENVWTSTYTIEQGANSRGIFISMLPDKPCQKNIIANVEYYFEDKQETKFHDSESFTVRVYPVKTKPEVELVEVKTEVYSGEEVILNLSVVNPLTSAGSLRVKVGLIDPIYYYAIKTEGLLNKCLHLIEDWEVEQKSSPQLKEVRMQVTGQLPPPFGVFLVWYYYTGQPEVVYSEQYRYLIKVHSAESIENEEPYHEEAVPVGGGSHEEPYVEIHTSGTDIKVGEEVILTLSAINPITSSGILDIQLTLAIPEGWSVTTSGFNYAGAGGLWTSTYTIEQGPNLRSIYVHLIPNQTGRNKVVAYADYYFVEQPENKNRLQKEIAITVTNEPNTGLDRFWHDGRLSCSTPGTQTNGNSDANSMSNWGPLLACWLCVVGIRLFTGRR
jgi:uncharacterized delta-60 repeat protein